MINQVIMFIMNFLNSVGVVGWSLWRLGRVSLAPEVTEPSEEVIEDTTDIVEENEKIPVATFVDRFGIPRRVYGMDQERCNKLTAIFRAVIREEIKLLSSKKETFEPKITSTPIKNYARRLRFSSSDDSYDCTIIRKLENLSFSTTFSSTMSGIFPMNSSLGQ